MFGKMFFFFFSSRRRHTRLTCDWSSDVCSSDLTGAGGATLTVNGTLASGNIQIGHAGLVAPTTVQVGALNITGTIDLQGGGQLASLIVGGAAPATLTRTISLYDDALLQFGSGTIKSISSSGALVLNGGGAVNVAGRAGNDSALNGALSNSGLIKLTNGGDLSVGGTITNNSVGVVELEDGSLVVGGSFTNLGTLYLDLDTGGNFGVNASMTVDGNLTNKG